MFLAPADSAKSQSADSLKTVHRLYLGSLDNYSGGDELRQLLLRYLKKSSEFELVMTAKQADAILEGRGELWIKSRHTLSPRARANSDSAEALYGGYLSVRLRGKDDEILWSYFADPRRVTMHDLPRDLVDEVMTRLKLEHNDETTTRPVTTNAGDVPATVHGGGATFPLPLYDTWFKSFHGKHPAWTFDYTPGGSEKGVRDLTDGHLDFAGSDIPPQAAQGSPLNSDFFPSVAGAVVLVFNLPDFHDELHLTANAIAGIFSGTIRQWNDPQLRMLNPSANLPDATIQLFHRSDGSGTTFAFSDFLSKTNPEWKRRMGAAADLPWQIGKGLSGNEEVAAAVASTRYSLGYAEFIYAFNHRLSFASVQNHAGRFVLPDLLSIMAAANWAGDKTESLSLSIVDSPEASAYPISTLTWILVPRNLSREKKTAMSVFLEWMLTAGQRQCSGLGYAPLPRNVLDRELSALRKFRQAF